MNLTDHRQLHIKRIKLSDAYTLKLNDPYLPQTWQIIHKDRLIDSNEFSQQLKIILKGHDNVAFDIDHDDLGQRKYISLSNILENIK